MKKICTVAAFLVALSTPVFAQAVIETPTSTSIYVPVDAPGVITRQEGSTGDAFAETYSPNGQPADKITMDSAVGGNEGQPERIGSIGSGGGK